MNMKEHTTHIADTLKTALPDDGTRDLAAQMVNIGRSSINKRVAGNVERRSTKLEEMLAWLGGDILSENFLNELLRPYGYGVHRIRGYEECPAELQRSGVHFCADMADVTMDGDYCQSDKRIILPKAHRLFAKLGGFINFTRQTLHIRTPVFRRQRVAE